MSNQEQRIAVLEKGFVTPIGRAMFPKLFRPDTKFDADGVYSIDIIFDSSDDQSFVSEHLEALAGEYQKMIKKKVKNLPISEVTNEDGEDTGQIKLKAKVKAMGKYGPRRPAVYDSTGKQITNPIDIGNGSLCRAQVNVKGYNTGANVGLTLELVGVQIIELVEYQGASHSGFEAVEGGFVAKEEEQGGFDVHAQEESADY
jgi:hypothetical protein